MRFRKHAREWALRHASNALLQGVGRRFYRLLLLGVVHYLRSEPAVCAIYLRRGMARGDWIAGASDIDLCVIFSATPGEEPRVSARILSRFRRLARWIPVPLEYSLFEQTEFAAYLREGDARGRLAPYQWKALLGRPLPEPPSPGPEWGVDCLDEALHHFHQTTRLAALRRELTRNETRNFIKALAEVLLYSSMSQQGRHVSAPARPRYAAAWLRDNGYGQWACVLEKTVYRGYHGLSEVGRRKLWAIGFFCLDRTARRLTEGFGDGVSRSVNTQACVSADRIRHFRAFFDSLKDKMAAHGIDLGEIRVHHRAYVSCRHPAPEALSDRQISALLGCRRTLRGLCPQGSPPPVVVSPALLRVLPHTLFYQEHAFYTEGIAWNGESKGDLVRLSTPDCEWLRHLLKRKRVALASHARLQRDQSPERYRWLITEYLPRLEAI